MLARSMSDLVSLGSEENRTRCKALPKHLAALLQIFLRRSVGVVLHLQARMSNSEKENSLGRA